MHIGNYLGSIKKWVDLQEKEEDLFFFIADLHAITTPYNPAELQEKIFQTEAIYLAAGLDPQKCVLFVQSQIKEHTELAWYLETITPVGELRRMTQFKEKAKKHPDYVNSGLLNYPVLMASDIFLYKAEKVPVGLDQLQHLELARTIARKFNRMFGKTFPEPQPLLSEEGDKIASLQEPTKKMSKTDNEKSYISLYDTPESIKKKIMAAVTDTGKEIKYNPKKKPGISNLLVIYSKFSGKTISEIEEKFKGAKYVDFKKALANLLIEKLEPIRRKRENLLKRPSFIKEILEEGRKRAQKIASSTIEEVKMKMGLL